MELGIRLTSVNLIPLLRRFVLRKIRVWNIPIIVGGVQYLREARLVEENAHDAELIERCSKREL